MKQLLKLVLITIILTSCNNEKKEFSINGYIEGIKDNELITLHNSDNIKIDSTFSVKGKFIFNGKVDHPQEYSLKCNNESSTFWVENVEITFNAKIIEMHKNSIITGGEEQALENELDLITLPYLEILQEENINQKQRETAFEKLVLACTDFGKKHPNSYLGLSHINRQINNISKDTLIKIYENLKPSLKNSKDAKAIKIFLYEELVEIGKPFIDFEVKTIEGKTIKLSSLKGKYIYLHFWSSTCGPCRKENRFLSKNFNEIPEDITIVNFSLDNDINIWKKASKKDNIIWTNISGNKEENLRIKSQYGVKVLPTSYFIDQDGIVLKKGSYGEHTITYLKSLIKKKK